MTSDTTQSPQCPVRPIQVCDVIQYLPHRPPMVWIDEVMWFSEKAGECRVQLQENGLYFGARGIRPSSFIEFIAQAYGFISVCHHIYVLDPNCKPLSKAFLASIKDAKLPSSLVLQQIRANDVLTISVAGVRNLGSIVSFSGYVKKNELQISTAQMKVFKEYQT